MLSDGITNDRKKDHKSIGGFGVSTAQAEYSKGFSNDGELTGAAAAVHQSIDNWIWRFDPREYFV